MTQVNIARIEDNSPETHGIALSRRSFIEVVVGSLVALPVVSGGLALPFGAEKAHATDVTIVVAKSDEVAVVVMDMAGDGRTPVKDARVVMKSCFNKKTVEGKTNGKGTIIFNIANLAEDAGKKKVPAKYEFYAEIEVTKEGYRIFRTGRVQVEGARGIAVPTRKLEEGVPYPSRVTFDDWDVLYTGNEFCVTEKNDARHSMQIDLNNLAGSGVVKASLYAGDKQITSGTATPKNGSCSIELREHFLMTKAKKVLPEGADYSIRYEQEGEEYRAPLSLKTCSAKGGYQAPGVDRNFSLSPFSEAKSGGHKGLQITFPSGLPLIGGQTLPLWKPEFNNLDYGFDPFGYVYASYRTTEWGYKSKDGKVVGNGWQYHPRKTVSQQWEQIWDDAANNTVDTLGAIDKWKGVGTHVKLMRQFSATLGAQVSFAAKWGEKEADLVRLRFGGQVILAFDYSLAWQFLAGPVPLVFEFSTSASFTVGLNIAASTPKLFDFDQWRIDYTNSALSLTIDISPSISLGVGIKGALSVSLKGVFTITVFIAATVLPEKRPKDVQNPHVVVGIGYNTQVVIQFLFITVPFKLPWKMNEPHYYDNWKGGYKKDYATQAMAGQATEKVSFLELVENAFNNGEAYLLNEADFEHLAEDECLKVNYDSLADDEGVSFSDESCEVTGTGTFCPLLIGKSESAALQFQTAPKGTGGLAAGSSSLLTSQAGSPKVPAIITPYSDKLRIYLYNKAEVVKAGVKRTGSRSGLVPNAVEIFSKNSFGDPHIQVHTIFGRQFIFRIASVGIVSDETQSGGATCKWNVGDSTVFRSRIICEGSDDTERKTWIFDFNPFFSNGESMVRIIRDDYDDYDYDMLVQENGDKAILHFFIISGHRKPGTDPTTVYLSFLKESQTVSYVSFELDKKTMLLTGKDHVCYKANAKVNGRYVLDAAGGGDKFLYHHYSCPQITLLEDSVGKTTQTAFAFSYLDRAATEPRKVLSQKEGDVRIGAGFFYYTPGLGIMCFSDVDEISEINDTVFNYEHKDRSVYQMTMFPRCGTDSGNGVGWYIVMLRGVYTYYFLVEAGAMAAKKDGKYYAAGCRQPRLFAVYDRDAEQSGEQLNSLFGPAQLVNWPKHDGYLASVRGKLVHVTLENLVRPADETQEKYRVPKPVFKYRSIGPDSFNVASFGVDDEGQYVFYPAVREGVPAYRYDEKGAGSAQKEVEEHDVLACKLRNGKFSDPFVFCEVDYDMDTLVACGTRKSVAMSFISTNLTNPEKSEAEIRYVAMPYVRCANVSGFSSVGDYAFPGVASPFNLTIRNDGNVNLSGCSIRLHKRGAKDNKDDTLTKIVFSKKTLVESNYNLKKSDGTLDGVESDYSLAPGKTSVYSVMLMIPKNWAGKVNASVTAQDFVAAKAPGNDVVGQSAGELFVQAEDESLWSQVTESEADEGVIDFSGAYKSADHVDYDSDVDYIVYADYKPRGTEYDEDGNEYVDYIVDESDYEGDDLLEYPHDSLEVLYSSEVDGEELSDAPADAFDSDDPDKGDPDKDTSDKDDPDKGASDKGDSGKNDPASDDSDGGSRSATKSNTARTGSTAARTSDPLNGIGGLFGVAAVAGAAMAAYSARRVANERAAAEGKSSEGASSEQGGDGE